MLGQTPKSLPKHQNQNKNDDLLDFLDSNANSVNNHNEIKNKPKTNVNIMDLFSFDDNNKKEEIQPSLPVTSPFVDNNLKPSQATSNIDFLDMDTSSKLNQNSDPIASNTTQPQAV